MDNVDKSSEEKTKNITLGFILSWIVGGFLLLAGIGFIISNLVAGILVLLGGIIMLPPVASFIRSKTNFHFSGGVRFVIALILVAVGVGMGTSQAVDTARQNATNSTASTSVASTNTAPASVDELELISYSCNREYGFFKVTGQVKNISGQSMESVQAVGTLYTDNGTFVKSDTALIEYNPVLPGQTSPFEVITTDNPAAKKCQVEFKRFWGGTISTKVDEDK